MKRVIPLALVAALFFTAVGPARAQVQDAVLAELGLSAEEAMDVCRYAQDVLYGGERRSSWEEACKSAAPVYGKLLEMKKTDSSLKNFYGYNEAVNGFKDRRERVEGVFAIFTGDAFKDTKDDSARWRSKDVRKCMTKLKCDSIYDIEDVDKLEDIDPPINARTFPTWLEKDRANKMLPFFLISQNEKMRVQKYQELRVPLDEKKRKEFCKDAAVAERCAQFARVQKQLENNKTMIHGLEGISDPDEFAKYIGEGKQREADAGGGEGGVFAEWWMASDDSHLPVVLRSNHSPDGDAPPEADAGGGPPADESYSAKAKALGAAGLLLLSGVGAWGSRKWKLWSDAGEEEVAAEDRAAMSDPSTAGALKPGEAGAETMGLTENELAAYNAWKKSGAGDLESFLESQYSTLAVTKLQRGSDALLMKIRNGQFVNQSLK